MTRTAQHFYEFGSFRIDAAKRLLLREGNVVPLTPKAFDLLLALVEEGGQVVEKAALMSRVWPDSFVEEGNLTYNVSMLRKALGERAGEHQYIVTVPGRGYRFVANLSEIRGVDKEPTDQHNELSAMMEATLTGKDNSDGAKANTEKMPFPAGGEQVTAEVVEMKLLRTRRTAVIIALLIALPGIGYLVNKFIIRKASHPFQSMTMTRLTTNGRIADAVISPDGKYVAYVIGEAGSQSVCVRQVAAASIVPVLPPADVKYYGVTFTQDGNHIFYVRDEHNSAMASLYQVPLLGGTSKKLISDVDSRVSVSPDGSRLAFIRFYPLEKLSKLVVANADGSSEQILAVRKGSEGFGQYQNGPAWSPDGKIIACSAYNHDASGLYVNIVGVRIENGEQKPITSERWSDVGRIAWLQDASGMVTTIGDQTSSSAQIWLISYPSGEARRITNDLNAYNSVTLAANSSSMVAVHTVRVCTLWIAPNGEAARARQLASGKFIVGADTACVPYTTVAWTPDGRIVFTSTKSGNRDIWIMDADGGDQKQLTIEVGANFSPTVSPDGRYIVFVSDRAGSPNIWRMDIEGGNPKRLTSGSFDIWPRCASDGRWVFYGGTSFDKPMVSKVPIDGGASVRLSEKFLSRPSISPNGKLVACTYTDEQHPELPQRLALVSSEQGEIVRVIDSATNDSPMYGWTGDGSAVMCIRTRDGISNIYSQPLDGSPPKQVTDFNSDQIFQFAWSPDGKNLLCSRGVETSDVVLISNFR
ncbi:MAG TPA: winged helix-turn-helix domain-containing protein [Blastocatellia bacterium]|nr:winged helix-turn-helix domain-containing protein [Blastocatellia bacterium]